MPRTRDRDTRVGMRRQGDRQPVRLAWAAFALVVAAALVVLARNIAQDVTWPAHEASPSPTDSEKAGPSSSSSVRGGAGDATATGALSALRASGDVIGCRHVAADLAEAATCVLGTYRDAGDCVLVDAGYLDLLGNVWSCTVQGDGWVELCTVRADGEGASDVTTVRMEAKGWEDEIHDEVTEGEPSGHKGDAA